jgi:hypothetical protein
MQIILYGFTKIRILKSFYTKENCENKKAYAYSMPIIIAFFFWLLHHYMSFITLFLTCYNVACLSSLRGTKPPQLLYL